MTQKELIQALVNTGLTINEALEAVADYTADEALVDALKADEEARIAELTPEYTVTYEEFEQMNEEERKTLWTKINVVLDQNGWVDGVNLWDVVYETYCNITAVEDAEYYARNIDAFNEFVRDNIEGRAYDEIDADTWGTYSDWHKDMYGFRPHW